MNLTPELSEQFKQLTTDYENAVRSTFMAFAAVGPNASSEALAIWKKALEKEESIRARRDEVLKKLLK